MVASRRGNVAAVTPASLALAGALLFGGCERTPSGSVYVTAGQSDEVVRLRAADGSVMRRIPLDRLRFETDEPHAVAVDPDGAHWYATVAHGEPSFWKFEVGRDRLVGRVALPSGGAAMIGVSPDGATAFVPDYDRVGGRVGRVAAIRLHDLAVLAHAAVCGAPHEAAVHPHGDLVAVACAGSDEVVLLGTDLSIRRRIQAPPPQHDAMAARVDSAGHGPAGGSRPLSVAWSPDGATLAVALHAASAVWLLDRNGDTRALHEVPAGPAQVTFADAATAVTANRMDGSLAIVDLASGSVRRVPLPIEFPHGVALDGRGTAFVACEGTIHAAGGVVAVDLERGAILWERRVGRYVLGVAFMQD